MQRFRDVETLVIQLIRRQIDLGNSISKFGETISEFGNSISGFGEMISEFGNLISEFGEMISELGNQISELILVRLRLNSDKIHNILFMSHINHYSELLK